MKRLGTPPFFCLITEGRFHTDNYDSERLELIRTIRGAVSDGINLIQIRERELQARLLFELTREIVEAVKDTDTLVLVNDRVDVALAAGADGVHLRESSLPPTAARTIFPRDLVIGVSTHSVQSAASAAESGADFAFFGPVFESPGKGKPTGTGKLQEVCRAVGKFPVIALGGIDSTNVDQAFDAGASGVAGIRSMQDAKERRRMLSVVSARKARLR